MATLVFTVIGSALGGPLGGAIGGLIGREVDGGVFGNGGREGPRIKELSVTTSSYGQPIPRVFGRMRVAGTVIWSTELNESSTTEGGKGKPKSTTYSYSASFAVALSGTPIVRIGRIWADGNLLRGVNGDLKVEGTLRVYRGRGDDPVDPLIAADKGGETSAFRDCAYVVFEDLQLADFDNRIPALTFEIFADEEAEVALKALVPGSRIQVANTSIDHARGFADEGGPLISSLAAIDRVLPLTCAVTDAGLQIDARSTIPQAIATLPQQLSTRDSDDARERHKRRGSRTEREPLALRYYDEDRDYQPGVQRANGLRSDGREVMIDLPAVMNADGAKQLANANAHRSRWRAERVKWRIGQLDPAIRAGSVVRLPDAAGYWLVKSWEWFDRGIELDLERLAPDLGTIVGSDAGIANPPKDLPSAPTNLAVIEVPPDNGAETNQPNRFAVASAQSANWSGAALFAEQDSALVPIGNTGSRRAVFGALSQPLGPSASTLFEPAGVMEVTLYGPDLAFEATTILGLANGANRLCVGAEIVQFGGAVETSPGQWRLEGLLRGRGGTEDAALLGHATGANVTLLDERLTPIDPANVLPDPALRIAGIGRGDPEPVFATLQNAGLSRRPPAPVHPRIAVLQDGTLSMCWTRRARGQWRWDSLFEVPLVEQQELYRVGYGAIDNPHTTWTINEPVITLDAAQQAALISTYGEAGFWVRQIGTFAQSPSLHLTDLT